LALVVCVAAAGCQSRLSQDLSYKLGPGESRTITVDPPRYDQKVTVTIDADGPVSVYVYLKKDGDAVEKDLGSKQASDKALGSWSGSGTGTAEATVPAKQEAVVRVEATKKETNVRLKIVGK
jgi:hypothetical protein